MRAICKSKSDAVGRRLFLLVLMAVWLAACPRTAAAADAGAIAAKPYRVLLVINEWSDPSDLVVKQSDRFEPVAALLKAWSVPFDILRLDQQRLDATYLFRRNGKVRYGAVVWLADSPSYSDQSLSALAQAAQAGTGLIVIDSRFKDPVLDKLLGLKFKAAYTSGDAFRLTGNHYIVRGLKADSKEMPQEGQYANRLWVAPTTAQVLITQGVHPMLTVNHPVPRTAAIWLGASNLQNFCDSPFWRNLLFRSLVWDLGYVVRPDVDYAHRLILELDDWGTADKGFLNYWRYLEPSEQTLRDDFIAPLKQHHATASAMTNTGYVDRKSQRVLVPWKQVFTDMYGLHQNYASTRKGMEEAMAAGVLNIESHGWTHMEPDLESAPGPWWTADLQGEASHDGWYEEFRDRRRDKDVPAAAQLYHMKRSITELQEDFGVVPLELKPGGDAWSKADSDLTPMLAARVGFGLFHSDSSNYYLDHEIVLDLGKVVPNRSTGYYKLDKFHPESWPYHADGPVILGFHDRDIAMDHDFLRKVFARLPADYQTIATNEYIGILHTSIQSSFDGGGMQLTFTQDPHYCAYFAKHPSSWQLWMADPMKARVKAAGLKLTVDNKPEDLTAADFSGEAITIHLPAGAGVHTWKLSGQ